MDFYGENCQYSNQFVSAAWSTIFLFSFFCFVAAVRQVFQKIGIERLGNISFSTTVLVSISLGSCVVWAGSMAWRCFGLTGQRVAEYYVSPIAVSLLVTTTLMSSLSISFVWVKISGNVMKWITSKRVLILSRLLIALGTSFLAAMLILLVIVQSYLAAEILICFLAVFVATAFLTGARMISKKLNVRPTTRVDIIPKTNIQLENRSGSHINASLMHDVATNETDGLEPISGGARKLCVQKAVSFVPARSHQVNFEMHHSELGTFSQENRLSQCGKAIMKSAWAISANCWSFCCASVLYSVFSENVRQGVICTISNVLQGLNAIFVNLLILSFLSAGFFPNERH